VGVSTGAPEPNVQLSRRVVNEPQPITIGAGRDRPPAKRRPVIALESVTKVYGLGEVEVQALRGITLGIERGDYVAIMGSSGSGKTTLMNIIGCLDMPTSGRYLLDGIDVRRFGDDQLSLIRNRKVGFVFQSYNLIPRTTALQNVELPLTYAGVPPRERLERARVALESVGLADRADHEPSELSGGQQQRVAIARAIVGDPSLILADEPTGNLDSGSGDQIMEVFDRVNAEGRTVVVTTHEEHVAARAKRVVRLADGLIVSDERRAPVVGAPPHLSGADTGIVEAAS
jgi:putative ABC transport system ATP-binding protein